VRASAPTSSRAHQTDALDHLTVEIIRATTKGALAPSTWGNYNCSGEIESIQEGGLPGCYQQPIVGAVLIP